MGSDNDKKKSHQKEFVHRNSLLIDLFENRHIRTVYNLFLVIFIHIFISTTASDFFRNGQITLGLHLIKAGFGKIHVTAAIWAGYFAATCAAYQIFKIWGSVRRNSTDSKFWDRAGTGVLLGCYGVSFAAASFFAIHFQLPPASAAIVTVEQVRLLMKIHSFIRTTATRPQIPPFSRYLYFLFVPTLLYRDTYPRTKSINWDFVVRRLLEIIGVVFWYSFILDRFINPSIKDFGLRKYTVTELFLINLENTPASALMLLPTFFLVLHSWQNLFAELTRFGDRMFYLDWWTCTDFSGYFRKWNIIVQDWLYEYIYKELSNSKLAVFVISAIVHEWVVSFMFGFFFPLLLAEFLILGSLLTFVAPPRIPFFNTFFLFSLYLGESTIITMYAVEYYARANAPVEERTLYNTLVPRFLTCDCIELR